MKARLITESTRYNTPFTTSSGKTYTDYIGNPAISSFVHGSGSFPYPEQSHPEYTVYRIGSACTDINCRDSIFIEFKLSLNEQSQNKIKGMWQFKIDNYIHGSTLDCNALQADITGVISAIQQSRVKPWIFFQFLFWNGKNIGCSVW